jgi:flagellar assembly protein FliH
MPKFNFTLRRPLHRIEIIKSEDIEYYNQSEVSLNDEEMKLMLDNMIQHSSQINIPNSQKTIPSEKIKILKPVFTEEFKITNSNQPLEISLAKVPEESLPLVEVKKEVQEAYDNGFIDGQQITKSTYELEIQKYLEWIRNFDNITDEFKRSYFEDLTKLEDSVVSLAIMVAGHILEHEVSVDSNIVIDQCRKALNSLSNETIFKIFLHPDNIEILKNAKSRLVIDTSRLDNVALIADDNIDRIGCVIETSAGTIDARLKTQLERTHSALINTSITHNIE